MKLEHLTEEQIAAMPKARDEWIAHGLSTKPANRSEAEAGVKDTYKVAGLEPPQVFIWVDSPLAGCIASWMLTQVEAQVEAQVGDQVRAQIRSQIGDQVRAQVGDQVRAQTWKAIYGQHAAGWLSFYNYLAEHCDISAAKKLSGINQVAKNAGWWWPFENTVILSERPNALHLDAQGRMHHETGPAMQYPDGFAIHAWHGTRVPKDLIETGWNTDQIWKEKNTEIRRCAIEKMGWDVFIESAGLQPVGEPAPDPGNPGHIVTLYDLPEQLFDEQVRVLLVTNATVERDGTSRRFGLTVPAEIQNPSAAWTFGLTEEQYEQLQIAS